jgi:hypothetical protein
VSDCVKVYNECNDEDKFFTFGTVSIEGIIKFNNMTVPIPSKYEDLPNKHSMVRSFFITYQI